MRLAILGTGSVGRSLAEGFTRIGHTVTIGTRDPAATMARSEPDQMGTPAFAAWAGEHPNVSLATLAEAAAAAELIVNATSGLGSLDALEAAGAANLAGKPLLDVSNPLDFSQGFPPSLSVANTDSLAEQLQRAFPDVKVVKTLNTVNAGLMIDPASLANGEHTLFLSGDHEDAKAIARTLLTELGWRDIVDLGDLSTARGVEMFLPLWVRLYATLGTPNFNIRLVR